MGRKRRHVGWLELLLAATVVALVAQFIGLVTEAWRTRARAGVQVPGRYVGQVGDGADATPFQFDYLLYLPSGCADGREWPLVVYLHGAGERGHDVARVRRGGLPGLVDRGQHFDFILVSPQCPADSRWEPDRVVELIEHISSSFRVDRGRVYLTGYSMGGFGTWKTACFDPDRFAAIVPLCGGGDVGQAGRLRDLPIWAFHGAEDQVVPLQGSQAIVDAVRECGGRVKLTVHPGYGHDICDVTYNNQRLYEWLLAQRRGRPCGLHGNIAVGRGQQGSQFRGESAPGQRLRNGARNGTRRDWWEVGMNWEAWSHGGVRLAAWHGSTAAWCKGQRRTSAQRSSAWP